MPPRVQRKRQCAAWRRRSRRRCASSLAQQGCERLQRQPAANEGLQRTFCALRRRVRGGARSAAPVGPAAPPRCVASRPSPPSTPRTLPSGHGTKLLHSMPSARPPAPRRGRTTRLLQQRTGKFQSHRRTERRQSPVAHTLSLVRTPPREIEHARRSAGETASSVVVALRSSRRPIHNKKPGPAPCSVSCSPPPLVRAFKQARAAVARIEFSWLHPHSATVALANARGLGSKQRWEHGDGQCRRKWRREHGGLSRGGRRC